MAKGKQKTTEQSEILELNYQLAELPSSQHRAGLAGLVLMVKWLERKGDGKGICELARLDERGMALRINLVGLEELFNEVYGAFKQERQAVLDSKDLPSSKADSAEESENNEEDEVKARVIPRGAFLPDFDPSEEGIWTKLWRDMLFTILRSRDKQRIPFKSCAEGKTPKDAQETWEALNSQSDRAVKMPSTFYVGAQDNNAENVPFKDQARYQFLLSFWPFVAQIYVPTLMILDKDKKQKPKYVGYALAIPDVANLRWFTQELPRVLKNDRNGKRYGYLPEGCIVYVAIESALDLLSKLKNRLVITQGAQSISDLILAVDVVHLEKRGNNICLLGTMRLDPEITMIDEYARLRGALWDAQFRKQRLLNLVNGRQWYFGFDQLLCTTPYEQTIQSNYFRHDVRWHFEQFKNEVETMNEDNLITATEARAADDNNSTGGIL